MIADLKKLADEVRRLEAVVDEFVEADDFSLTAIERGAECVAAREAMFAAIDAMPEEPSVAEMVFAVSRDAKGAIVAERDALRAECDALKAFKAFVHRRLDEAGVPVDPPGPHRDAGCRIGQRLDVLIGERDRYRAALEVVARCWRGRKRSFSPPNYYMGHSERCGGKGNDRPCSCASNQSRSAFLTARSAVTLALTGVPPLPWEQLEPVLRAAQEARDGRKPPEAVTGCDGGACGHPCPKCGGGYGRHAVPDCDGSFGGCVCKAGP